MSETKSTDEWREFLKIDWIVKHSLEEIKFLRFFNKDPIHFNQSFQRKEILEGVMDLLSEMGYRNQDVMKFTRHLGDRTFNNCMEKLKNMGFVERLGEGKKDTRYKPINPSLYADCFKYLESIKKAIKLKNLRKAEKL
jgi:hypothetical protein